MPTIKIIPLKHDTGNTTFSVRGTVLGTQRRKQVKTEMEALTLKQNWEREIAGAAPLPAITTRLTAEQAEQAEHVFRKLASRGLSLDFCVDYTLTNYRPSAVRRLVSDAYMDFIAAKVKANKRGRTVKNLELRLSRLTRAHGAAMVDEVTGDAMAALVFRAGSSARNQVNDIAAYTNFFNFCLTKKFLTVSPMEQIEKVSVDDTEPQVMPLADVRRLLIKARAFKEGKLVPYVVLALFCAIRPKELERAQWERNVRVSDGVVNITADIAKKRSRRSVSIPANALEWLRPFALKKTPIVGPNWRKDWDELRVRAGFKLNGVEAGQDWIQDGLRHTGISYRLADSQDDAATALWAGNSPEVIHAKYKGLVSAADVAEFWSLTPDNVGTVIVDLHAKAA